MAWRGCGLPEYSETGGRAFNLSLFNYSVYALIKSGGVKVFLNSSNLVVPFSVRECTCWIVLVFVFFHRVVQELKKDVIKFKVAD